MVSDKEFARMRRRARLHRYEVRALGVMLFVARVLGVVLTVAFWVTTAFSIGLLTAQPRRRRVLSGKQICPMPSCPHRRSS
jgi:hypothetical protein